MRIRADQSKCQGYGTCVLIAPELFDLDERGSVLVLQKEVSGNAGVTAMQAARECPTRALALDED